MPELLHLLRDVVSGLLLAGGSGFLVIGSVGLLRLPDLFTRLHASGITDTLGAALVLAGLAVHAGLEQATIKLALILLFVLFTSPTATHALAKAALHGGMKPRLAEPEQQ